MKGRKILIVTAVFTVLLVGCGKGKMEDYTNIQPKTTNTTVTTTAPVITDTTPVMNTEAESSTQVTLRTTEEEKERSLSTTRTESVVTVIPNVDNAGIKPITVIPNVTTITVQTTQSGTTSTSSTSTTTQSSKTEEVSYVTQFSSEYQSEPEYELKPEIEQNPEVGDLNGVVELPSSIMNEVRYWQNMYPSMTVAVGLYSLDGTKGYEYNAYQPINSACTIKATYALYVLNTCEAENIDIWNETITYEAKHKDSGTSTISDYGIIGSEYSIGELLQLLLGVSDNTAFSILEERFPIYGMYEFILPLGGENDWQKWGQASVIQRKNEWVAIYNYVNSGSRYSSTLREFLTNTSYSYLTQNMVKWHSYMQKSGWSDTYEYPATNACAIIDDSYILIVMTEDYSIGDGHLDVVQDIGRVVEEFYDQFNGNIF